jgi:hypothetical protein
MILLPSLSLDLAGHLAMSSLPHKGEEVHVSNRDGTRKLVPIMDIHPVNRL